VRSKTSKEPHRVLEMLEHIGSDYDVESVLPQLSLEVDPVEISDDDALAKLIGSRGSLGVELDGDDPAPSVSQNPGHVTCRAPELQHPLPSPH
jgi:hypothetical protein